jgi:hypothetical protein
MPIFQKIPNPVYVNQFLEQDAAMPLVEKGL